MKRVADDSEAGGGDGVEADRAQFVGTRELGRVGGAAIPFAQQMDTVHQPPPCQEKAPPRSLDRLKGIRAIAKTADL